MATRFRKWTELNVYTWIYMFLFLECAVWYVKGHNYADSTQSTLCAAQCEALCLTDGSGCETKCNGIKHWMTDCDGPNCTGTCSIFYTLNFANRNHLLHVPDVTLNRTDQNNIVLSWNVPTELSPSKSPTPFAIIYIVEETHPHPKWPSIRSVALKWVKETNYTVYLNNTCNADSYRVMAVNKYGSFGFSNPVQNPVLTPGAVQNIRFAGNGVYYYVNKNNTSQSRFMAILKWDLPAGWQESDIHHYEWNPMVRRYCKDVSSDSLPIFTPMRNQSRHVLMTIGNNSFDCTFMPQVRAVSKCNTTIRGPWTDFKVNLTDCRAIIGYKCDPTAWDPPGNVENVTLNISSTPVDQVLQMYANPYTINNYTQSPLLINLRIYWQPPSDKGSEGFIDHYTIRHGPVERLLEPLPPSFVGEPSRINVAQNIHELEFPLPTQNIPYTYGVQVVALGPGQVIQPNDWGLFDIRTIIVSRNDSGIGQFLRDGKVLLDKAGLVIVYVDNYVRVQFMFDQPMGRMDNSSIDRLALQWGPLVGPEKMKVENRTVVPLNQSSLMVTLKHPWRSYGVRMMYLEEDEEEPGSKEWEEISIMTFTLPHVTDGDPRGTDFATPEEQLTPLYITMGCIVAIVLIVFAMRYLARRRHFKHLERRLLIDDVSEDGEHYFVMRPSDHSPDDDLGIPTVVPDQWELPHCCLKMGGVLGSGAFGQVVKGRVSKTMLVHRGIGGHTVSHSVGTHVTVAIKMLQDAADQRHTENFLREIDMMKDIGYHRNIVSILGCCTLRQPSCLVVEHMQHGDLLSYMGNIRHKLQESEASGCGYINQDVDIFSPRDLLSVARQITAGMEFLSQKGFVHRDLAARNVLVGNNKTVKIGDFGLARYIYQDTNKIYVTRRGGKLPLRWMSPEAIFNMTFSTASDVWSFGILLYEIVTLGGAPYPALSNTELLRALKHEYRMERPDNCSQEIYHIMLDCWKEAPGARPSFTALCQVFTSMLEEDSYLEYFNFNVSLEHDYYTINSDGMDTDFLDLDDQGIPTAIENPSAAACVRSRDKEIVRPTLSQMVTTEIPDSNCTVVESSGSSLQDDQASYTDEVFHGRRYTTSISSFNNELYSTMTDTDHNDHLDENFNSQNGDSSSLRSASFSSGSQVSDLLEEEMELGPVQSTSVLPSRFTRPVEERISASSDEVFTSCLECTRLGMVRKLDSKIFQDSASLLSESGGHSRTHCTNCGRLDTHLTPYEIHVTERNDSAVCSTASDDSDHSQSNQSELSAALSDAYLMPESPKVSLSTPDIMNYPDNTEAPGTFSFNQSDSTLQHGIKKTWLWNFAADSAERVGCSDERMLNELKDVDQFLLEQGKAESDIWFICQTKF